MIVYPLVVSHHENEHWDTGCRTNVWRIFDAGGSQVADDFYSEDEADEIAQALNEGERMRVENQRLKEFLRPFARLSESIRRDRPDEYPVVIKPVKYENMNVRATVGDLRRAADALREGVGDDE